MNYNIIPISRIDSFPNKESINRYWKLLLFSDGSMTRNLENLTQSKMKIEIISEKELANESELDCIYKEYYKFIEKPVIQRKVIMKNEKLDKLVSAISLWNVKDYNEIMKDKGDAIGNNLIQNKHEYFREILQANILTNYDAEQIDDEEEKSSKNEKCTNNFRSYFLHHNRKVLTYIEEVFLKDIDKYIELN